MTHKRDFSNRISIGFETLHLLDEVLPNRIKSLPRTKQVDYIIFKYLESLGDYKKGLKCSFIKDFSNNDKFSDYTDDIFIKNSAFC